ncbi:MAG TPA: hypothetical protein VGC10_10445 [Sphingomonas sp.]
MIEGIAALGAISASTPSAGYGIERRRKRLKWLSSLRGALSEAGPLVDELGADGADIAQTRARIEDALRAVEELNGRFGGAADEAAPAVTGSTITATDLARRITASAERSLAAQAHAVPAAVRRYVGEGDENFG